VTEGLVALLVIYLLYDIRSKLLNHPGILRKSNQSIVMDTSALIDRRIVDVVRVGFANNTIIVPKRVLDELQLLADGKDTLRRERARVGLDAVSELQQIQDVQVVIDEYLVKSSETTDEVVLKTAKARRARLCTTDYNLNKVAKVEGVTVMNVNELAQVMRPDVLPGEEISVKIIQKGDAKAQGVGYLGNGTMVVVEAAFKKQGKTVVAIVDRTIQTKAGKMIFATLR